MLGEKHSVLLDLSALEFVDSAGVHLLINALKQARADGWQFEVDPEMPPQAERLFKLTDVERITGIQLHRSIARQALLT